mmetsp:Transcript_35908/g.85992  ORF Transcript_35908/g.85992 Transcript_35908/m.85992 type:complete len:352 (+) Transcript_35908:558-1613(+)
MFNGLEVLIQADSQPLQAALGRHCLLRVAKVQGEDHFHDVHQLLVDTPIFGSPVLIEENLEKVAQSVGHVGAVIFCLRLSTCLSAAHRVMLLLCVFERVALYQVRKDGLGDVRGLIFRSATGIAGEPVLSPGPLYVVSLQHLGEEKEDVVSHKKWRQLVCNSLIDGLHHRRDAVAEEVKLREAPEVLREPAEEQHYGVCGRMGVAAHTPLLGGKTVVQHILELVWLQEHTHHAHKGVLHYHRDAGDVVLHGEPKDDVPKVLLARNQALVVRLVLLGHGALFRLLRVFLSQLRLSDALAELFEHRLVEAERRASDHQLDVCQLKANGEEVRQHQPLGAEGGGSFCLTCTFLL